MFIRKLRVFLNIHNRLLCSQLPSAGYMLKVNLNHSYRNYLRNIKTNLTYNNSQYKVSKNLSNLFETLQNCNEEDNNNNSENADITFSPSENLFSYSLLLNNKKLESTIMPRLVPDENITEDMVNEILNKNYDDTCSKEILDDFKTLSLYRKRENFLITDEKFEKILLLLKNNVSNYTNEEIKDIFRCLELWMPIYLYKDKKRILPHSQLVTELDNDCFLRLNDFEINDYLIMCDLYWRLRHMRSKFVGKAIIKLGKQVKKLKPEHYLQYLFIISASRKSFDNMYELEYALEFNFPAYNAEELSIICLGFFKTKFRFYNPLLKIKIVRKFIDEIDTVRDIALSAVFKIVRFSFEIEESNTINDLMIAFQPRIKEASAVCVVHAAHAICTMHLYNKEFMDEIIKRFQELIPTTRLKDLERILFCLMAYKYPKDSPIYEHIINEFRNPERKKELEFYPMSVSTSLMYLSQVEIYPLDIISKVLDHEYLQKHYKMNPYKIGREYLIFNTGIQIEVPEYKGPLLPEKVTRYLHRRFSADVLNLNDNHASPFFKSQRFLLEVISHLRDILGASSFFTDQLLPQYSKQDIIFCLDKNNNFVSPKPHFPDAEKVGVIKYAPNDPEEYKWLVFILAPCNIIFFKSSITIGLFDSKMRQLKKIGYHPIPILATKWASIASVEGRTNFLRSLLFSNHIHNTKSC